MDDKKDDFKDLKDELKNEGIEFVGLSLSLKNILSIIIIAISILVIIYAIAF